MAGKKFDFIIAGGGMAGLSLAFYLNKSVLRDRKILIIDQIAKNSNDHTWCFWEKGDETFEKAVFRKWNKMWFHGTDSFSKLLNLEEYQYKMIRAADFYEFIFEQISENPNFEFLQAKIKSVVLENHKAKLETFEGEIFTADFVFDSFTREDYSNPQYRNLRQHFLGLTIETEEKIFNPLGATLFDFRVEQKDECRFIYILPHSANKALIEFTVFSENLLSEEEYEFYLKKYISENLKIESYKIAETERGIIPMTDAPYNEFPQPHIIRIGTAGGYVKPSTGYSFSRTQKRLQKLVKKLILANGKFENFQPHPSTKEKRVSDWKLFLDSVLLDVLKAKSVPADTVFTHLFSKNSASQMLKFLDEDTSLKEDLKIMQSVPLFAFGKSAAKIAFKKLR